MAEYFYVGLSSNAETGASVPNEREVSQIVQFLVAGAGAPVFQTAAEVTETADPNYVGEIGTFKVTVELIGTEVRDGE